MVCKKAPCRQNCKAPCSQRHYNLMSLWFYWSIKKPPGLDRQDGKRPDGLTLIPCHDGRLLVSGLGRDSCEPTCCFLCQQSSHRCWQSGWYGSIKEGGKILISLHNIYFILLLLKILERLAWPLRIHIQSADVREGSFLFQRISVAIQRSKSVLLRDTLVDNLPNL